jgi:hypothetical protein
VNILVLKVQLAPASTDQESILVINEEEPNSFDESFFFLFLVEISFEGCVFVGRDPEETLSG